MKLGEKQEKKNVCVYIIKKWMGPEKRVRVKLREKLAQKGFDYFFFISFYVPTNTYLHRFTKLIAAQTK
jgi:capsule polysaccharide export protein KpsE/RkpR